MAIKRLKWRYVGGAAVMLAVALVVLAVFSLLSITDRTDIYLMDTQRERYGWRYELLVDGEVRPYEPVFKDGYVLSLPEGTDAVRMTRTMTEDFPEAELEWMSYIDGVEVFLDGDLLHTDFPEMTREADGFVRPDREQWDRIGREQGELWRQTRMSLPADYLGRELTMITYFPEDGEAMTPEYPFLGGNDSDVAGYIVFGVKYNAFMTVYAILALSMAGLFLLDMYNGNVDGKTLLLCLYFLLVFLQEAYSSDAGYYSVLRSRLDLRFLNVVYVAPLYLYLALRMRSRWKWPLCAFVIAWAAYEGVREFLMFSQDPEGIAYSTGPGALVVLIVVLAAFCIDGLQRGRRTRQEKKRLMTYGLITAAVTAAYLLGRARVWGGMISYLQDGVWTTLQAGNCWPLVAFGTDIISYMTVIVVMSEIVRRTVQRRRTIDVLMERERQTMESYKRMLAAEDATNAMRHEMRHHMTALSAILKSGEVDRAASYVDAVAGDLEQLPAGRYSKNVLVNAIAGSYLDRAAAQGVRVEHRLAVPPELDIADEDLSVFLSNMLQNALEACERMDRAAERYIHVDMQLRGNFLFIRCVNTMPDEPERRERRPRHGYGIAAMRRIAEKYNSVLVIKRASGAFSVMSDLCLRQD